MDEIEQLRRKVDKIDDQIVDALSERVKVCRNIGLFKKKKGLQTRDNAREKEIYKRVRQRAAKFGLDPLQVEAVFNQIVNMCRAVQE
jgi:chorismate mutase